MQRFIVLDGVPLEQVPRLEYLGSRITKNVRYREDIRARVGMAVADLWQNKTLLRRNYRLSIKIKILTSYVFSVFNYGCENRTWNIAKNMTIKFMLL
jgi:hypothetical protein